MNPVYNFLQETAPLPPIVDTLVYRVTWIHSLWRVKRKSEIYGNPDNWLGLAVGGAANQLVSWGPFRLGAHVLLVATRVDEYVEQVGILYEECGCLGWEIDNGPVDWVVWKSEGMNPVKVFFLHNWERVSRLVDCVWRVVRQLFVVGMHLLDVFDAWFRRDEAINEVVVNMERLGREEFLERFYRHKETINGLFGGYKVVEKLEPLLGLAGNVSRAYQGVNSSVRPGINRSLKKLGFES